ncbi:SH3 domain and tetratricopeptide repeat-containing protein 1 isoform X2 [Microcaecilia unicolor]|uniref:SH3 domain and tetratricopeptide repeat-containing protein 1 isoform X2 n=1 Tax=Microcaecilia unicolor TaxID=1415580 RepID=A0A6P7X8X7_9AMPH|nr:SH3 domain and tetratricopeptide repeat-containing protein 1 isoform X2 [Microcaecilia unicolor]
MMELSAAEAVGYHALKLKLHAIKEEEGDWRRSELPQVRSQRPSFNAKDKHGVRWEENKQQVEGNESSCMPTAAVAATNSIKSKMKEKTSSQEQNDISLTLVMVRKKSGLPDPYLQGKLRARLRLLENDNKEVMAVFSELSARLLSIHSDQDLIIVTFKTYEEVWKFSTYYSLGFVNHCMENLLLDQAFWLFPPEEEEEEETGIDVYINEESLNMMYKGLLMQEGTFFVLCPDNHIQEAAVVDGEVRVYQQRESSPEDIPGGYAQNIKALLSDKNTLPRSALEPVSPFHQWFLKAHSILEAGDVFSKVQCTVSNQIAVGFSVAVVDYRSDVPEEISFRCGDRIKIIGSFIECMQWFVGRHMLTGHTGFVKTCHVKADTSGTESSCLEFLAEEEKSFFTKETNFDEEEAVHLLKQISNKDLYTIYRVDKLEELDSPPVQEKEHLWTLPNARSSIIKGKVKEALMKCQDAQHQFEETERPGDDKFECATQETCSSSGDFGGPHLYINQEEDTGGSEALHSLLLFLNDKEYQICFKNMYDLSCSFLDDSFHGYIEEEELVRFLGLARETAKKADMPWALTRICLLLGRLCAKKLKFSQARVYFEEALGVLGGDFSDIFLVMSVYTNLTAIYLKQKNKKKWAPILDKVSSLLMGIPNYICSTDMETDILKYALRKTVLSQDMRSEARACFLLAKLYTNLRQREEALPFIERLQILNSSLDSPNSLLSVDCYFKLGDLYSQKCLPHIALSCIMVAASLKSSSFMDSLRSVDLIKKNSCRLSGLREANKVLPTQTAHFLRQALSSAITKKEQQYCSIINLCLSELYVHHREYDQAIDYRIKAVSASTSGDSRDIITLLLSLAWLYVLSNQNTMALDIMSSVLDSALCTSPQRGVIYNMSGIALRRTNEKKPAAENLYKALQVAKETGMMQNQAVVLANLGILCLQSKACTLAEHYLLSAVKLCSGLHHMEYGSDFIQVLLILGSYYINMTNTETGRLYYEWALLVSMEINHFESQLQAIQLLCWFYSTVAVNEAQCIIYNKYRLSLAQKVSDKVLEGQILETISHLYFSLGTERAYRSALKYTKRSLGIFIDLQQKEKEAYSWLRAGRIYHILGQKELVDLYIQVALDTALCTGDPHLGMDLFEAAGDVFFNGTTEREKAVSFYRDRALPLAVKTGNIMAELQLCNKLVELLLHLKSYEESLEYAKTSLALSVSLGNHLNERVAYHRLAGIYHHLGQCELAEHFYLKALSLCSSPLEFDEEAVYYVKVYLTLGDIIFYDLKDPFDAAGYYHLALAAAMDLGNKKAQLKIYTRLAIIYHNFLVDRELSLFFYQKARTFALELNVRRINLAPDQFYHTTSWIPFKMITDK